MLTAVVEMPKANQGNGEKGPPTKPVRVKVRLHEQIMEICEATGQKQWEVVEELTSGTLPQMHKAIQPQLKRVRERAAQVAAAQAEGRKAAGLPPKPSAGGPAA